MRQSRITIKFQLGVAGVAVSESPSCHGVSDANSNVGHLYPRPWNTFRIICHAILYE